MVRIKQEPDSHGHENASTIKEEADRIEYAPDEPNSCKLYIKSEPRSPEQESQEEGGEPCTIEFGAGSLRVVCNIRVKTEADDDGTPETDDVSVEDESSRPDHHSEDSLSSMTIDHPYAQSDRSGVDTTNTDAPFRCSHCLEEFKDYRHMLRHVETHIAPGFICRYCDNTYANPTSRRAHESTHTGENRHHCRHCDKSYFCRTRLRYHERVHSENLPCKCQFCGQRFAFPSSLKAHEDKHRGKTHHCSYCSKSFTTRCHMKNHERSHTGDALHRCQFCNKTFARHAYLLRHERKHRGDRPFKCDQCDKAYTAQKYLSDHKISHSAEKQFMCSKCGMAFHRREHCVKHETTHRGEVKPFKCGYCLLSYTTKASKDRHELQKHEKE